MDETVRQWYETKENVDEMALCEKCTLKKWEQTAADTFPRGARVLDIGCGMGREAFALSAAGFRVTGIDISREVIRRVTELSAQRGCDIAFSLYDGHTLPFDDGSFDAVIIWSQTFGLLYGDAYKRELLGECRRVLTDGGMLSFSGHDYRFLLTHYGKYLNERRFYPYADTGLYWETFTPDGLAGHAGAAGFTVITCAEGEIYRPSDGTVLHCLCEKSEPEAKQK